MDFNEYYEYTKLQYLKHDEPFIKRKYVIQNDAVVDLSLDPRMYCQFTSSGTLQGHNFNLSYLFTVYKSK